jgi:uncharacterized membrane protein
MSLYVLLKSIHIVFSGFFLGAGLCIAGVKIYGDRQKSIEAKRFALRFVVMADYLFTIPSGLVMPISGYLLVLNLGLPLDTDWVVWGFCFFSIAGIFWLPAFFLQKKMLKLLLSPEFETNPQIQKTYQKITRVWLFLGLPSFTSAMLTVYVMVTKTIPFFHS